MGMATANDDGAGKFRPLQELIDAYIGLAIRFANGNIGDAAKLLGVGRATLYRRVKTGEQTGFPRPLRVKVPAGAVQEVAALRDRIRRLREAMVGVGEDQENEYQLGKVNGLILALHIMEGRPGSPAYL